MFDAPLNLDRARILVSNDDGVNATGLKVLEKVARRLSRDVWVVAPETEQSAASHSLTLHRPLRLRKLSPRRFTMDGTPTDCVLFAVQELLKDGAPDLVLSGVNRGGNMGEDVTYSGTIAAAMEGALLGIRSIALSLYTRPPNKAKWATAERHAGAVIQRLAREPWPPNVLINVNFPDVPAADVKGIRLGRQGRRKIGGQLERRVDPRGNAYYWIGSTRSEEPTRGGTDIALVQSGLIAVTPLHLNLTHGPTLKAMRRSIA